MEVDADLVVDDLRHEAFAELGGVVLNIGHEFGVFEPCRVEALPEVFQFLVELEGPGEGLLGDGLVAVDDFAGENGDFVHEEEGGEVGAAVCIGEAEVAVAVLNGVGKAEKEGEEPVAMVE